MVLKMVICPDCGKEVKDAKFCSNCGSPLQIADETVVEDVETKVDEVVEEIPVEEEVVEESVDEPVEDVKDEPEDIPIDKKSKFCPSCGKEITSQTVFCPQCGFKLIEDGQQTKFCQNCGKKIDINAEICPYCGVRVANTAISEEKNVLLSAILSILFPGLGQIYLGLTKKGISFIIVYIVAWMLIIFVIGFVLAPIVWLWSLIDAIKSTEAINKGEYVEDKLL